MGVFQINVNRMEWISGTADDPQDLCLHGTTNMELVRSGTDEWYWSTDYVHGDLYEAEELFKMGHPAQSNRLYLIHEWVFSIEQYI